MDTVFRLKLVLLMLLFTTSLAYAQMQTHVNVFYRANQDFSKSIQSSVEMLINQFNESFYNKSSLDLNNINLTAQAKNRIESIWESTPLTCTESDLRLSLLNREHAGFELRGIPVSVRHTDKTESAELVIIINHGGRIDDVSFALEYHNYLKIMDNKLPAKETRRRQMILSFVENYRTAYNRKDLTFLNEVFSEHALIIVGRVLQEDKNQKEVKLSDPTKVTYLKMNKNEYMKSISQIFSVNKQIRVNFDDIDISISPNNNNIYGVRMIQTWRADNYADKGYLFLIIDFTNEEQPKIYVRSWQPEKETPLDSIFDLGDFMVEG